MLPRIVSWGVARLRVARFLANLWHAEQRTAATADMGQLARRGQPIGSDVTGRPKLVVHLVHCSSENLGRASSERRSFIRYENAA